MYANVAVVTLRDPIWQVTLRISEMDSHEEQYNFLKSVGLSLFLIFSLKYYVIQPTSAAADSDPKVARSGVRRVNLKDRLERRQNSMFNAWTSHLEQTRRRRPRRERTACNKHRPSLTTTEKKTVFRFLEFS